MYPLLVPLNSMVMNKRGQKHVRERSISLTYMPGFVKGVGVSREHVSGLMMLMEIHFKHLYRLQEKLYSI